VVEEKQLKLNNQLLSGIAYQNPALLQNLMTYKHFARLEELRISQVVQKPWLALMVRCRMAELVLAGTKPTWCKMVELVLARTMTIWCNLALSSSFKVEIGKCLVTRKFGNMDPDSRSFLKELVVVLPHLNFSGGFHSHIDFCKAY